MKTKNHNRTRLWFDRLLSRSLWRQFLILGIVLVVALGVSYLFLSWSGAEWEEFCNNKDLNKWLLPIYLLIDSNALNNLYIGDAEHHAIHGWMLIASSITFLFGAFVFNGIIIGIITNSIERRVANHKDGHIYYLKSGHYIIMGYDDMVPSIITHVFEKDKDAFVLILTSADVTDIREKLSKCFDGEDMKQIILNFGHRVSADAYKNIHLEGAEEIFVVGNHIKPAHDAINVECVDSICRYLAQPNIIQRPSRITCFFKDLDTYAAFKTSEIFRKVGNLGIEFVPYNFFMGWAKQVFIKREYKDIDNPGVIYKYPCVYGEGITPDDDKYVHLVFVGTTNFAVAFAMEAAHVLHFPNSDKVKTLITFIDKNADKEKDEFITRNRHLFEVQSYLYRDLSNEPKGASETKTEYLLFKGDEANFLDVEFEFIKGDIFSQEVQNMILNWANEHNEKQYLSIFLALADQRQNFVMGMNMPDKVYDKEVNVFIRQDRSDNFVTDLRNADLKTTLMYSMVNKKGELKQEKRHGRYAHIYPFGMNRTAYCADEHSLKRAKLINYLYCTMPSDNKFQGILVLDAISEERIWAEANEHWKGLTVALKWSNLYSAYAMRVKQETLRTMRRLDIDDTSHDYDSLSDNEVEALAKLEHNRWNVEKLLMGFKKPHADEDKYANPDFSDELSKNKKLFIHHDIRPFDKLGTIAELDKEFSRYIPWIMKMTRSNDGPRDHTRADCSE